ncbi:MAG: class I SAM-dependent methyltransferase [Pseudomonadota bacterium]
MTVSDRRDALKTSAKTAALSALLQGYAANAAALIDRYEAISFDRLHRPSIRFFPKAPAHVMDVGAGTGRDAARLAHMGHKVVAAEPLDAFRCFGARRHPSPLIDWRNACLPLLSGVPTPPRGFDLVLATACWMHLPKPERRRAMARIADMLAPDGAFILTIRHGPAPIDRTMFDVTPGETISLARQSGLWLAMHRQEPSVQGENRHAGVTWTRLAFRNAPPGSAVDQ